MGGLATFRSSIIIDTLRITLHMHVQGLMPR